MLRVERPLLAKAAVKLAQWEARGMFSGRELGEQEVQWSRVCIEPSGRHLPLWCPFLL